MNTPVKHSLEEIIEACFLNLCFHFCACTGIYGIYMNKLYVVLNQPTVMKRISPITI